MINAAAIGGDGFGRPPLFVEAVRRSHATKPPTQLANSNKISARLSAIEDRARFYVAFEGGRDDQPQINSRPVMALLSKLPILAEAQRRVAERNSKPLSGELCELCQRMIREGDCSPLTRVVEGFVDG